MSEKVLVFTIALNGYDLIYRRCIQSQRDYADCNNYSFRLINRIHSRCTPAESSWLKIPLILQAIDKGFDWVAFIDADCEVKSTCPRIESVGALDKSIYMAQGYSGRFNAGVIIVRNTPDARHVFGTILAHCEQPVPIEDEAPYENGHVIHFSKGKPMVGLLDARWNNNNDPNLDDYIRHYSAGPMRPLYRPSPVGRAVKLGMIAQRTLLRSRIAIGERLLLTRLRALCPPL